MKMNAKAHTVWKYCYWLTEDKLEKLRQQMKLQGKEPAAAKQNPCEIMLADIGYAAPATGQVICKHDAVHRRCHCESA